MTNNGRHSALFPRMDSRSNHASRNRHTPRHRPDQFSPDHTQPTNTPTPPLERTAANPLRDAIAARSLDVPLVQASHNVVPVAAAEGDKIQALRQ